MGRKANYTKEEIIKHSFNILVTEGTKGLTTRNIAKKLGVSTITIYSSFSSMDELKNEISKRAKIKLFEYTKREYTKLPLLNIGIGVCVFAMEEKALFRTIFLREDLPREFMDEVLNDFRTAVHNGFKTEEKYKEFSSDTIERIIKNGYYFIHGYATLICTGFYPDIEYETFKEDITNMGKVLIEKAFLKNKGE